jgi:uncharacterized protein (DUF305 family)
MAERLPTAGPAQSESDLAQPESDPAQPESDPASDSARRSSDPVQPPSGSGRSPSWLLALVVGGAAVAMLLLGAAGGLLIGIRQSESTAAPAPDSVDVGFCQNMTVHHRQAVTMSVLARQRAENPILRTIAFDIESTQTEQIGRMQGWLSLWGRDRSPPPGDRMAWMNASGGGHGGHGSGGSTYGGDHIHGMATPDELDRLSKASGAEFDVLFLQLMVRHHQGGNAMLQAAVDNAEVDVVRNLARQTFIAQNHEVEYMISLLAERGAKPLPN